MFDEHGNVLFIDLGMALRVPPGMENEQRSIMGPFQQCGKFPYMSPEIYESKQPFDGYAVDLWSCCVVLYLMLTGPTNSSSPQQQQKSMHHHHHKTMHRINNNNNEEEDDDKEEEPRILYHRPHKDDFVFLLLTHPNKKGLKMLLKTWDLTMSEDAIDLLQSIFQLDPNHRPSLDQVMEHPWVTNPNVPSKDEFLQFVAEM
eukprot:CAMPEP_0118697086 /NCGR_PEP_ID=MMETSP0800-20121206/14265_1 /TAXON_ID=210618 ORGANISM="Striatella unipunctata, Strain CCMP2910" /NCGR_SAMPLE_ID=MMETSP0800 /ASSEMBLY_ACC=CAM_ASM_000638 /LENGTH=200 /DNA_ID=CAMNT_0006596387 /DNA_START=1 /DNA_END=603 /DNA_ORIENTATION=+